MADRASLNPMEATSPLRFARALILLAVAATVGVLPGPASGAAAKPATVDGGMTAVLRSSLDARRKAAGLDPMFARTSYNNTAATMARTLASGGAVRSPADGTPSSWLAWNVPAGSVSTDGRDAIDSLSNALDAVLRYPMHTDGGWAFAVAYDGIGNARIGLAALVGWPDPAIGSNGGCSGSGFCWTARGVNPHLPWTRNRLPIYLSIVGAPPDAESLVKSAIARINGVSGLGTEVIYGGTTTDIDPTAAHRFLVQWHPTSACGNNVLGCTVTDTQGSYKMIYGARITIITSRYLTNPVAAPWIGTLSHEIGHALGLGHYDGAYGGKAQLMRSSGGPHTPQSGDVNGLRTLDRPGALWSKLVSAASAFRTNSSARMTVSTSSTGFGGVRSVSIQCVDRHGKIGTPVRRTGTWDIRGTNHVFTWKVGTGTKYTTTCRAYVTSKASRAYSPWVTVSFAG